ELEANGQEEPYPWNGQRDPTQGMSWCTWTLGPSASDPDDEHAKLPLNCVGWDTARAYCHLLGKDLPTEAQLEFLASGRGFEFSYAWGEDDPDCGDTVWGRG